MDDSTPPTEPQNAFSRRRAEMLRLLERYLKADEPGSDMAQAAFVSRFHFSRMFSRTLGEAPGKVTRRLRLERAAHELRSTSKSVTEIAFDAGYNSLEGFSRAFRRAFEMAPSQFRAHKAAAARRPAPSGVHYDSRTSGLCAARGDRMDLTDRLIDGDYHAKRRLLEAALALPDAQLDAPLAFRHNLMPFVEPEKTLREALSRMTGDGWILTLLDAVKWPSDRSYAQVEARSVHEMIARLEAFHLDYAAFVGKVKVDGSWEAEWLDATCEQEEVFTYGGTIEATLTWGIAQRMVVQRLLEQAGLRPDDVLVE